MILKKLYLKGRIILKNTSDNRMAAQCFNELTETVFHFASFSEILRLS